MSRLVLSRLLHGLPFNHNTSTQSLDQFEEQLGGDGYALQRASADVLSDMLRSPLILSSLEADSDQLARFLGRVVAALSVDSAEARQLQQVRVAPMVWGCQYVMRLMTEVLVLSPNNPALSKKERGAPGALRGSPPCRADPLPGVPPQPDPTRATSAP